jgi:ABC-type branched-subunit amino acid transport system substrate-binding protein
MTSRNSSRRQVFVARAASAALSLLGFPAVLRPQASTLKVGVILPLSGELSFPGIATRKGTELAIKMMAEQGAC